MMTDPGTGEKQYPLYMGQSLFGFVFSRDPSHFGQLFALIYSQRLAHPSRHSVRRLPLSVGRQYVSLSARDILRFSLAQ